MAKTEPDLGKLVYCNLADTWGWENNRFRSLRFLTANVSGSFRDGVIPEYIQANKLRQGDLIHFRPTLNELHGFLSVVHAVDKRGVVHLGNINVTEFQLHMIDNLHIAGKI
jgi:hypothetical protein